jgi:hypothetical protein
MTLPHRRVQGRQAGTWVEGQEVEGQETVSRLVADGRIRGEPLDGRRVACRRAMRTRPPTGPDTPRGVRL